MSLADIQEMRSIVQDLILQTLASNAPMNTVVVEETSPEEDIVAQRRHSPPGLHESAPTSPAYQHRQNRSNPSVALALSEGTGPRSIQQVKPGEQGSVHHSITRLPVQPVSIPQVILLPAPSQQGKEESVPNREAFLAREIKGLDDLASLPPCQWCGGTEWRMRKDGLLLCACYFRETGEVGMEFRPSSMHTRAA